jgi:RecA-family ATPase
MPLFQTIRETARSTGTRLIVVDNIAQTFAGNENIRAEVTAFVYYVYTGRHPWDGAAS